MNRKILIAGLLTTLILLGCGQTNDSGSSPPNTNNNDTTPPTITSVSPTDQATAVDISSNIVITFSENIDPTTLTKTTGFSMSSSSGLATLSQVSVSGNQATITLSSNLVYNKTYTATVINTVKDTAGNRMANHYIWSFTTGNILSPHSLTATASSSAINLDWSDVNQADSYSLYWSTSSNVSKTTGTKINCSTSNYTHTGLTSGTTYYYVVTTVKGAEESPESASASATPYKSITLDTGFNSIGYKIHNNAAGGNSWDAGMDVVVSNGKAIVAGYSLISSLNWEFAVWNINADGSFNTSFSGNGIFTYGNLWGTSDWVDAGNAICIDSNGNYLIAGYTTSPLLNADMGVVKINSSGILDTSFNHDGNYIGDLTLASGTWESGNSICYDSANDRVISAGYAYNTSGNPDMTVWVLKNSDGLIDNSFSGDGVFSHNNAAGGNNWDIANGVTVDASGNIYVTGYSFNIYGNPDMAVWKITPTGQLDTTFGSNNGIFVHNNAAGGSDNDSGNAIALDSQGNILVVGHSYRSSNNPDLAVWKLTPSGQLDSTFNSSGTIPGIFTHNSAAGGNGWDVGNGFFIDSNGKILITGLSQKTTGDNDMAIWCLNSNGTLDTSFNGTGYFTHGGITAGNYNEVGTSIKPFSSGKLVVAGYIMNSIPDYDMVIWMVNY